MKTFYSTFSFIITTISSFLYYFCSLARVLSYYLRRKKIDSHHIYFSCLLPNSLIQKLINAKQVIYHLTPALFLKQDLFYYLIMCMSMCICMYVNIYNTRISEESFWSFGSEVQVVWGYPI